MCMIGGTNFPILQGEPDSGLLSLAGVFHGYVKVKKIYDLKHAHFLMNQNQRQLLMSLVSI